MFAKHYVNGFSVPIPQYTWVVIDSKWTLELWNGTKNTLVSYKWQEYSIKSHGSIAGVAIGERQRRKT